MWGPRRPRGPSPNSRRGRRNASPHWQESGNTIQLSLYIGIDVAKDTCQFAFLTAEWPVGSFENTPAGIVVEVGHGAIGADGLRPCFIKAGPGDFFILSTQEHGLRDKPMILAVCRDDESKISKVTDRPSVKILIDLLFDSCYRVNP